MAPPADAVTARALLAVARMVHAEMERANLVVDDLPEMTFACVGRWCEGAASEADARAAKDAFHAERAGPSAGLDGRDRDAARCYRAVAYFLAAYVGGGQRVRRRLAEEHALTVAWTCLARLGEPPASARARVEATYAAALAQAREAAAHDA